MNFDDEPKQAEFRSEIRAWLKGNATPKGQGNLPADLLDRYDAAKDWYQKKASAGYACLDWPKQYGGAGLTPVHKVIWSQEMAAYEEPDEYFMIGIGNCGPAIMNFSSEEDRLNLLPKMASAEHVWCQLFSEPSAGSDVAGLRTSAKQTENGDWCINGQKVWTSLAQFSDYGVVLCRTDPTVSKYKGLTMFIIDMQQAGVEVKPIRQIDGGAHFNEVFFNDAVIPDRFRLGAVNGGWEAALLVLMNERMAISAGLPTGFADFLEFVKTTEIAGEKLSQHPLVRAKLAEWHAQDAGVTAAHYRQVTAVAQGGIPGAQGAIGKLVAGRLNQEIADFTMQLLGNSGAIWDAELSPQGGHFQHAFMYATGIRIAGGTDEIMKNILAEQVLGLPQEPRADKGLSFQDIPRSA